MEVKIFVDGSSLPTNPGYGGWGVYAQGEEDSIFSLSGGSDFPSTNNQMEMEALIQALLFLDGLDLGTTALIYSDSQYVVNGVNTWMHNWKKSQWKGGTVLNMERWIQLYDLSLKLNGRFELLWVKGHGNCFGNNEADKLANLAARNIYERHTNKGLD